MNKQQYYHFLTYDYSNYDTRELIYNKVLHQYHTSLKPDASLMSELDIARGLDLKKLGICKIPNISSKICMHLKNKYFQEPIISENKRSILPEILIDDPILIHIFSDKKIIRPIQEYLGIFPSIQFIASWENKGGDHPIRTNEMYWHMDHHGHRFVKVFYYLDDVILGMGHHQFISNTHNQSAFDKRLKALDPYSLHLKKVLTKKRSLRGRYKIEDDAIWPIAKDIIDVIGSAGKGFAEDTRGIHRGTPLPPNAHRRIIQCLYLPIPNGKDKRLSLTSGEDIRAAVQKRNNYTNFEIEKLFSLLDQ